MFDDVGPMGDDYARRTSLPGVRSISSASPGAADLGGDRRLPPLPRVEPLPRGPFNPFNINTYAPAPSPPASQYSFPIKSTWPPSEYIVTPPSPATSADSSWQENFASQKNLEWPNDMSSNEIMALIAPQTSNRKPPLQQLCGRKRKGSMISGGDPDDQREKHRIAEGNRRKNLSQLHRELDLRIHDFFLERAGWNPAKSLPQSKEHIVQGAIFLIDFMLIMILHLMKQEKEIGTQSQLSEKMQPQLRCMQLQQLVNSLQQQNLTSQQQLQAVKQENLNLEERNRQLEFQLKSYEYMLRSPQSETNTPPPVTSIPDHHQPKNLLPGLRVMCDGMGAPSPDSSRMDRLPSGTSHSFGHSFLSSTPPMTGPSSPVFPSYSIPNSRRQSMMPSP